MWADADDLRRLLVADDHTAEYITSIYQFDEVSVGRLEVESDGRRTTVSGHGLEIELVGGRQRPIPFRRPLLVTRFLERPIARGLMGVETYGTSPTGAREWYQTSGWRWVRSGRASLHGVDLGPPQPIDRPLGVGFSEPPPKPSIVSVRVTIEPGPSQ